MSLIFIEGNWAFQVQQKRDGVPGLRLTTSYRDDSQSIDLNRDDILILIRHLQAYIEHSELMRV